ncbi:hypothetical protein AVEN_217927-1, partial [Araneus ventricosus]
MMAPNESGGIFGVHTLWLLEISVVLGSALAPATVRPTRTASPNGESRTAIPSPRSQRTQEKYL